MDWRRKLLIIGVFPIWCLGQSTPALRFVDPYSTIPINSPSASMLLAASTKVPASQVASSSEEDGQSAAKSTAAASASTALPAATLSQVAAAASSHALAEASNNTDTGSVVGLLAQVIIAIGVLPVEMLIVSFVLGIYRLVHRRSPRPVQTGDSPTIQRRDSLPFLQPKAELEDEQKRVHELHGLHPTHELDNDDEIFQMPDETKSAVLPLQGRQGVHEMPEKDHMRWEMPLHSRCESGAEGNAQELEIPVHTRNQSVRVKHAQELESPVTARDESTDIQHVQELETSLQGRDGSMVAERDGENDASPEHSAKDSTYRDPSGTHFMLRQQQMLHTNEPDTIHQAKPSL